MGSGEGEEYLSGESVLFHDLPSTSSVRHPRACCQRRSQEKAGPDEGLEGKRSFCRRPRHRGGLPWRKSPPAGSLPGTGGRLTGAAGTSVQVGRERLIPGTGSCQMLSRGTEPGGPPMLLSDDLSSDWDPWSLGISKLRSYGDRGPDPSFIWEMVRTLKPHHAVQWSRGGPSHRHTRHQLLSCPWGQALWLAP